MRPLAKLLGPGLIQAEPATTELYLDATEVEERRRQRGERHDTRTIPALRLLGFQLLAVLVILHNTFVLGDPDWVALGWFLAAVEGYCLVSWVLLRAYYPRAPQSLPLFLLCVDVVLYAVAVYVSGANRSWLFLP